MTFQELFEQAREKVPEDDLTLFDSFRDGVIAKFAEDGNSEKWLTKEITQIVWTDAFCCLANRVLCKLASETENSNQGIKRIADILSILISRKTIMLMKQKVPLAIH